MPGFALDAHEWFGPLSFIFPDRLLWHSIEPLPLFICIPRANLSMRVFYSQTGTTRYFS
jgi:hypothetical protein